MSSREKFFLKKKHFYINQAALFTYHAGIKMATGASLAESGAPSPTGSGTPCPLLLIFPVPLPQSPPPLIFPQSPVPAAPDFPPFPFTDPKSPARSWLSPIPVPVPYRSHRAPMGSSHPIACLASRDKQKHIATTANRIMSRLENFKTKSNARSFKREKKSSINLRNNHVYKSKI